MQHVLLLLGFAALRTTRTLHALAKSSLCVYRFITFLSGVVCPYDYISMHQSTRGPVQQPAAAGSAGQVRSCLRAGHVFKCVLRVKFPLVGTHTQTAVRRERRFTPNRYPDSGATSANVLLSL